MLLSKLKSYSDYLPEDEEQLEALYFKVARNNLKSFGDKLREIRTEKGIAQAGIANQLNVRQATYSDWENGRNLPRIFYLKELLAIYDIDPADLIDINPLKIVNDSFVPLIDGYFFMSKRFEDFKRQLSSLSNYPRIPVSLADKISFAIRATDDSMFGGNKPIYTNSVLLCSTEGLSGKIIQEQAQFCNNKICIVNVCGETPLIRLVNYENNVLSLLPSNNHWQKYCFPDGKDNLRNLDDVKYCLYNDFETHLSSVQIFGIVKKMYVDL